MEAFKRAQKSSQVMWANDRVSQNLGFELCSVNEGSAEIQLEVEDRHCNGHGILHGGVLFSLADSASAFAANSRNQIVVSAHNHISYIAPAKPGDKLTATATEASINGRNGIYDVQVTNHRGELIAHFKGMTRIISGQHFVE